MAYGWIFDKLIQVFNSGNAINISYISSFFGEGKNLSEKDKEIISAAHSLHLYT